MELIIFDLDDTLFQTKVKVLVLNNNKVVKRLTNQEYNNYSLFPNERFDFTNAKLFNESSKPISKTIKILKTILKERKDSEIIIVTARPNFDNKELFLETFRHFEIDIDQIYVERAGNLKMNTAVESKLVIFQQYLSLKNYKMVTIFDDAISNIKALFSLEEECPDQKVFFI